MPYAPQRDSTPGLPFSGCTPLSRLASYDGATAAQAGSKAQMERVYDWLVRYGPGTDHEIGEALRLPLSTVNARRNVLVETGRVRACGLKAGPFRARRTEWGAVIK